MMPLAERLLADLIALPSVNPAFLPPGDPLGGEQRLADFLTAVAARAGLDVEHREVLPGRSNLLVRLSPAGRVRQRVVLAPHLDTVGGDETSGLFTPRLAGGRMHGRGACDTKGSVAAMLTALVALARSRRRPRATEILFAGLVDEENNQSGARTLVRSGLKADLAIVGEPTRLHAVTAHKGDLWLSLETRGKAAHGATPNLGRNAVHAMARLVDALETDYARQLRKRVHPLLGPGTINVGMITGGTQPNIVPAQCSIRIDRRTLPDETEATVRREILELARARGVKVWLADTKGVPCPALETDPALPLVARFLGQIGQSKPLGAAFFCDAAVLANGGIPSVVFGPGDIAQAHTADEWISVRSLNQAAQLLQTFLASLP